MSNQPWLVFVVAGIIVAGSLYLRDRRAKGMLQEWANENGLRLLASEVRHLRRGPFFWTSGKQQVVYRVQIEDAEGQAYGGWVRCGGYWLGLSANKVEARWDEVKTVSPAKQSDGFGDDGWS